MISVQRSEYEIIVFNYSRWENHWNVPFPFKVSSGLVNATVQASGDERKQFANGERDRRTPPRESYKHVNRVKFPSQLNSGRESVQAAVVSWNELVSDIAWPKLNFQVVPRSFRISIQASSSRTVGVTPGSFDVRESLPPRQLLFPRPSFFNQTLRERCCSREFHSPRVVAANICESLGAPGPNRI